VRIERDEARYPSKGTWPQFRGRIATVMAIIVDHKRAHLTEYGVVFGKTRPRRHPDGSLKGSEGILTWFKAHELTPALAAEKPVGRRTPALLGRELPV
jgi:hypothetical protein